MLLIRSQSLPSYSTPPLIIRVKLDPIREAAARTTFCLIVVKADGPDESENKNQNNVYLLPNNFKSVCNKKFFSSDKIKYTHSKPLFSPDVVVSPGDSVVSAVIMVVVSVLELTKFRYFNVEEEKHKSE